MTPRACALVRVGSVALLGLLGQRVTVEGAVSQQLPGITIIGLPDAAIAESKQRVRVAMQESNLQLSPRMVVINLSPAAIPKHGSGFDLAIALSALAVSSAKNSAKLQDIAHIGELGLDGTLHRPDGLFTLVLAAKQLGFQAVMVPKTAAHEAKLVPGIRVIAVPNLREAALWHGLLDASTTDGKSSQKHDLQGSEGGEKTTAHLGCTGTIERRETPSLHEAARPDVSDVVGQEEAVEALLVAAAGKHNMMLSGPPGAGKTLLASRLITILPPLTEAEALAVTSVAALGNTGIDQLVRDPPFIQPHHSASIASIVGSVEGAQVRPGAITKACYGVLFLDEAPQFDRAILDALRQPMEEYRVLISRARMQVELPARFQLVLAGNPCPCGSDSPQFLATECTCTAQARLRYASRVSGPIRDRIDVHCSMNPVRSVKRYGIQKMSANCREQVIAARSEMSKRLVDTEWSVNSEVPGNYLRTGFMKLPASRTKIIDLALRTGKLSLRGYDRCLRLAWSIADLRGHSSPTPDCLAYALTLRGVQ